KENEEKKCSNTWEAVAAAAASKGSSSITAAKSQCRCSITTMKWRRIDEEAAPLQHCSDEEAMPLQHHSGELAKWQCCGFTAENEMVRISVPYWTGAYRLY
ncbi:unnamed protein product, partial [Musa textilis]